MNLKASRHAHPSRIRTPLLLFPSLFPAHPHIKLNMYLINKQTKTSWHTANIPYGQGHYNTTRSTAPLAECLRLWSFHGLHALSEFEMSHSAFSTFQLWEETEKSISPSFSCGSEESLLQQNKNNATDVRNGHNKIKTRQDYQPCIYLPNFLHFTWLLK